MESEQSKFYEKLQVYVHVYVYCNECYHGTHKCLGLVLFHIHAHSLFLTASYLDSKSLWSCKICPSSSSTICAASGFPSNVGGMIWPKIASWSTQSSNTAEMWIASKLDSILNSKPGGTWIKLKRINLKLLKPYCNKHWKACLIDRNIGFDNHSGILFFSLCI